MEIGLCSRWFRPPKLKLRSPISRSRTTFERTDDFRAHPATIEFTWLGLHALFIQETSLNLSGIKGQTSPNRFVSGRRVLVTPSRIHGDFVVHSQDPVGRHTLKLTE